MIILFVCIGIYGLHFPQIWSHDWLKMVLLCLLSMLSNKIIWVTHHMGRHNIWHHIPTCEYIFIQLYIERCDIITTGYDLTAGLPSQYKMWKLKLKKSCCVYLLFTVCKGMYYRQYLFQTKYLEPPYGKCTHGKPLKPLLRFIRLASCVSGHLWPWFDPPTNRLASSLYKKGRSRPCLRVLWGEIVCCTH